MLPYVKLLGTPAIEHRGRRLEPPPSKRSALLYYLAYVPRWASRDDLLYLLYPDLEERKARGNLRPLLTRLRRLEHAEGLEIEPTRARWEVATDVGAFRTALARREPTRAVAHYGGDLMAGFRLPQAPEFESWLAYERAELGDAWRRAVLDTEAAFEREGRVAEAAELLERLHGDDPLDEEVMRRLLLALARADRPHDAVRAYGAFAATLEREVDGAPEEATRDLVEAIRSGRAPYAQAASATRAAPARSVARTVLPTSATEFVGREREVAEVAMRLRDPACRLLSIVAAGGMGKSRVAIEAARRLASETEHGVVFVPLEAVNSAALVPTAVADPLSLAFFGSRAPRDQLLDHLAGRRMLLVLDNFEHLLDDPEGPGLVTEMLERAPGVRVLCTSRERLNLRAEWVYDLDAMELPEEGEARPGADAVALFLQAARRARGDLEPDLDDVVRICRLVDGMPLALELAASWLRVLSANEIANELEGGIGLLESPLRDLPSRHHSLRAVFDASWLRLPERERAALRLLATFRGGFRREAAREVAGVGLPLLLALANRSFLRCDPAGRFTQHPLVWQYLQDRAAEDAATADVQARHAAYFTEYLRERESGLRGAGARRVRDEIGNELANVRAAWAWAVEHGREDLLDGAAEGIYLYHHDEGRYHESEALFTAAAEAVRPCCLARGRLLVFLGGCYNILASRDRAITTLRAALDIVEPAGAKRDEGLARMLLWSNYAFSNHSFEASAPTIRAALRLFAEAGDLASEAEAIGLLAEYTEDPDTAEEEFRASIRGYEASGTCFGILGGVTLARSNYALFLDQVHGAYPRAVELYDEAIGIARGRGETYAVAWYLNNQATALLHAGEWDEAGRRLGEARAAAEGLESGWGTWTLVDALFGLGRLARLRGELEEARSFLTRAREQSATHGDVFGTSAGVLVALGDVALAEGRLDEAADLGERALGHFLALSLLGNTREWRTADCLVRLGAIELARDNDAGAGARFAQALAIVERWHLLPLGLHLAAAVAPSLRAREVEAARERLLRLAASCPSAMRETREAASLALDARRARREPSADPPFGPLVRDLRQVVRGMHASGSAGG